MNSKLLFLSALCALLLFGGCSRQPDASSSLSRVRTHLPKEPRRLFPLLAASSYESQVNELIYQQLLHFDPTTESLAPQLAAEMPTVSRSGDTSRFTFQLRAGIRWSDGQALTPEDVLFTLKAIWFPGLGASPMRGSIRELAGFEFDAANPQRFTLVAHTANLNGAAAYGNLPILPAHVYDPEGLLAKVSLTQLIAAQDTSDLPAEVRDFATEERIAPFGKTVIVGSGPYRFDSWEAGQRIRLIKHSEFWGKDLSGGLFLAGPDTLDFLPVPDAQAALAMLENGDLDVMANVSPQDAVALSEDDPSINIYTPLQLTRTFVYLNTKDQVLADPAVRKGLAHLLNVEGFLADVQLGFGQPLYGPYHPIQPYARHSDHPVPFSVEEAVRLFTQAGWTDTDGDGILDKIIDGKQQSLRLEYLYPSVSKSSEALALLYAADAVKAGVQLTPVGKEFGALLGDLSARNFQLVQGALGGDPLPDDPYGLWHTASNTPRGLNRSGFGDASSDALIDSIRVNLDEASRTKQYIRLAQYIADEQPVIFLIVPQERIAVRTGLTPLITSRRPGYYLPGFHKAEN